MQTVKVLRRIVTTRIEPGQPGPTVYEAGDIVSHPPGWLWRMAVSGFGRDGSGRKAPFAVVVNPPGREVSAAAQADYSSTTVTDSNAAEAAMEEPSVAEGIFKALSPAGVASLQRWMKATEIQPADLQSCLKKLPWKELVRAAGGIVNAKAVRTCLEDC